MKLYEGWHSSASWRVRWALALKRISYQSVWLDIARDEHLSQLPRINPLCTVPTLELAPGDALSESVAIIEWLDETHPDPPLLPKDARARARVRQLVQLINADIHPLQNTIVRRAVADTEAEQFGFCARFIERGLRAYEAMLHMESGRFSLGDTLTMADLYLIPQMLNAARFRADISACTRIRGIYEACLATPEAAETHPARAEARALAERAAT
jgi:maleylpyruvate isomerase